MRRISVAICMAVLLLAAGAAWSANLTVTYVEGLLQVKQGTGWKALDIGDTVADNATIQFDGDGVAELEGGGSTVTLRQAGTFLVSDMVAKTKEVAASGLGSLVRTRVSGVIMGTQKTGSTVAGVRASQAADQQASVSWIGNAADLIEAARKSLSEGSYESALDSLEEAYDYADEVEEPLVLFYTGYANAMLGNNAKALEALAASRLEPDSQYYGDLLILRGQLLVDALSFKDAFAAFDTYRGKYPTGASAQLANLMAGYCASQLGDRTEARRSLDLAQKADPASELGRKAGELIGKL